MMKMTTGTHDEAGGEYVPRCEQPAPAVPPRRVPFDMWWEMPVIRLRPAGEQHDYSRFDLISAVANTDGGAHFDPKISEAYSRVSEDNVLGWTFHSGDLSKPFTAAWCWPHYARSATK